MRFHDGSFLFMKKTLLAAVILMIVSSLSAHANTLSVAAVNGNLYQQTVQSPCIFTNPSCQQPAGFPSTPVPNGGNETSYDLLSPVYTGSQLLALTGGSTLNIGLDINQATGVGAQTLTLFTMSVNGSVVDTFSFGGSGNVGAGNNGNGFADYLISGFSTFAAGDLVQFHFVFNNANSGAENLFVIGTPATTSVPEPPSGLTLGMGLLAVAFISRKLVGNATQSSSS
jgi:hypothetical protein